MRKNLQCLIGIALMQVAATNSPGTFIDKSAELGFTGTAGRWAVAWADYNNDGYVDLYDGFTWKNNEGKGFTKLAHPHRSTGIFADYDNDGLSRPLHLGLASKFGPVPQHRGHR